jgi:hypothetical protein
MSTTNQRSSSKERFWRRVMRQWRNSGVTVRDFCAERDLAEPSFYTWRRTLSERDAVAVQFVPVQVVADERATAATRADSGSGLELVLRAGRVLRVGPGFDAPTLQRLLALLEEGRS